VTLSNRLRRFRNKRGFAASALAQEIGVSRQTIYAIESRQYLPNTITALKMARVLQVLGRRAVFH
jgi:DNA-binding XRE family transcriptional regulator